MKKLKLTLDELRVESFATATGPRHWGTVLANRESSSEVETCQEAMGPDGSACGSCQVSCNGSCDDTCDTCESCNPPDTCRSCVVSCDESCDSCRTCPTAGGPKCCV
jgi:hypothetical protein